MLYASRASLQALVQCDDADCDVAKRMQPLYQYDADKEKGRDENGNICHPLERPLILV